MPSGWTRFILEQFEFPFEVVYPKGLEAGNLSTRVRRDHLPLWRRPSGRRGPWWWARGRRGRRRRGGAAGTIPSEYQDRVGAYSAAGTMPALKKFLEEGGTILSGGPLGHESCSASWACRSRTTLRSARLTGTVRPLPVEKYYVPGSVLRVAVDNSVADRARVSTNPVDVFFDNSPTFELGPDAAHQGRARRSRGSTPRRPFGAGGRTVRAI